ncbi:helix-turn-helix transcriptional regulator [Pseudomonas sp. 22-AL-CL-001]|uniref:helix-turn-helix domain-containing protein n=1 Tax=Pseudomonas alabamensis TaxID=3064349 RepID=UPI0027125428|nr:helix-turn-helix transcriptional regulator [Pseudomonas sp. 22-AL-CL-001]MDO7911372.1 helix-turn-helix transcriptional regulator [Pseudomonas sp. 22-AL-CL-001]
MSKEKRKLEDWELAECAALKRLVIQENLSRPKEKRLTQEMAGAAMGMNQASFSNYLNGRLALNKDVAAGIYKLFGIPPERYSLRLAEEIADIAKAYPAHHYQQDDRYARASEGHRSAVDEMASRMLSMSEEQALKLKQAMDLLMPTNESSKD